MREDVLSVRNEKSNVVRSAEENEISLLLNHISRRELIEASANSKSL